MQLVHFMQGTAGRPARVLAGAAMIAVGIAVGGTGGIILLLAGILPLAAGILRVCVLAPLFGLTLRGAPRMRA
jgi:hypothetical protein